MWQDPRCSSQVETGLSENFLSCIKDVKDPCESQREGGISLETMQQKKASSRIEGKSPGFSRVIAGNLGFFSSYIGDLRDPLVLPQESQVSMRVASGLSGFLSSRCRILGPHLELRLKTQGSSLVLMLISWFLWSFHRGVRPCLVWRHAGPLTSQAVKVVSGFQSS